MSDKTAKISREGLPVTRKTPLAQVMIRQVITLELGDKTHLADTLMKHHAIHHLPVVENGHLRGLVSQSDLLRNMLSFFYMETEREQHEFLDQFLEIPSIMTEDPLTLTPSHTLGDALALMLGKRLGCLLIVDDENRLQGILTETDLLRLLDQLLD